MATNFPSSLDDSTTIPVESANTKLSTNHVPNHTNSRDALIALQTKVGIDGSAVNTSHDYKLSEITSTDKAVGKTATQTLSGKTFTSPTINVGSDAEGDTYYRNSGGAFTRLARGTDNYILKMNGNVPNWEAETVITNAATTVAGIVEEATLAEQGSGATTGATGARLYVNPSNLPSALFGDGSDGDATISSNTTLTSDKYYNNLTINSTFTLSTGGYRIFVKGTLTNNGTIANNGSNGTAGGSASANTGGTAGSGGATPSAVTVLPGQVGTAGGAGVVVNAVGLGGAAGTAQTNSIGTIGGAGGAGGTATGNGTASGGGGGAAGAITATTTTFKEISTIQTQQNISGLLKIGSAGTGGGSGGSSNASGGNNASGGGGGGGSTGGVVYIFARYIVGSGLVNAIGGNGGNGGNAFAGTGNSGSGGGGGGGGGAGGIIVVVTMTTTNPMTLSVVGGTAGTGGTGTTSGTGYTGANGSTGSTGTAGNSFYYII